MFRTSTIFLPLLTPTFRQTPVNDSRRCVKFYCSARVTALCFAPGIRLGLSQTSLVLPTALVFRRQAVCCSQLWSFADKLCVTHNHYGMRARAVDFAATAACPFGPSGPSGPSCKVFRDQTCASAFDRAPGIRLGCLQGLIASPCSAVSPQGKTALSRCRRSAPVAPGGGVGPVARRSGAWKNVAKCFENLPAFLRKDFRNLLPRFARGGTTIARHCDFLSPLDPFLGSLA